MCLSHKFIWKKQDSVAANSQDTLFAKLYCKHNVIGPESKSNLGQHIMWKGNVTFRSTTNIFFRESTLKSCIKNVTMWA